MANANEKKALIKNFKQIIDDLMDNYEQYTDEEKAQIKEIFEKTVALNTILDKYDIEPTFNWEEYVLAMGQYFDTMRY